VKIADLTLLSQDPFTFADDPRRLLDTRIDLTVVDGAVVYRA
jgi:predicted amidohydrolase YtcJ